MVCPTTGMPYQLWFALIDGLPYMWFTLRIFVAKNGGYENYNCCCTSYGLPSLMVYPTCGIPYSCSDCYDCYILM